LIILDIPEKGALIEQKIWRVLKQLGVIGEENHLLKG